MLDEIAYEIDFIRLSSGKIVLAQIALREDMERYVRIFKERELGYHFFTLRPTYETAVERCRTRTCHTSVTPEYWIKYFYDAVDFDNGVTVIDNSEMSVAETAEEIIKAL